MIQKSSTIGDRNCAAFLVFINGYQVAGIRYQVAGIR